jgi:hypothetical protein
VPILGTVASQFARKPFNSFESIATVTVGLGGSANVEFTSIPSTYTHLQIRANGKAINSTAFAKDVLLQFNSDTASNYSRHQITGGPGGLSAGAGANTSHIIVGTFIDNNFGSSFFSSFICDILDYTNTNKYTTVRSLGGYNANDSTYGDTKFFSGNWRNTNAITSIKIFIDDRNIDQNSQIALYGIKGS